MANKYKRQDILYVNCPDELDNYVKLKTIFDAVCSVYGYKPESFIDTALQETKVRSARRVFSYIGSSCGLTLTEMAAYINLSKERMSIWQSEFEHWVLERNDRFEGYMKCITEVQRRFNKIRAGE